MCWSSVVLEDKVYKNPMWLILCEKISHEIYITFYCECVSLRQQQRPIAMLVNFTFKNFRSFRDERTLSMEASSIKELKDSVCRRGRYGVLPTAVIYGANSSGKSNVLKALLTMRQVLLDSVRLNPTDELDFQPFLLDTVSPQEPTSFEIQFLQDDALYRYGFDYNRTQICKEWLYEKRAGQREYNLFLRVENEFSVSQTCFPEGVGKESATPANRLFVSLVAQLNGPKSTRILHWFQHCNYISGLSSKGYEGFTLKMFQEKGAGCAQALDFFHHTQLGFQDLLVTEQRTADAALVEAKTTHSIYDAQGRVQGMGSFDKDEMESEGTKKVIELSGPIFDTLQAGKLLVVDELDAKLHPLLTRCIVQLFMDPANNPHGAQLIFATHDTNLLHLSYLRRDQIWFTEKDETEASDLYSLVEFKDESGTKIRNDRSIQKDYINGRYGAIPFFK